MKYSIKSTLQLVTDCIPSLTLGEQQITWSGLSIPFLTKQWEKLGCGEAIRLTQPWLGVSIRLGNPSGRREREQNSH